MDNKNENKKIVLDGPTAKRVEAYARAYTRIHDVDKERLSNLVLRAKGENRSMRQFAEQIGTTPSTLSRLINMQTGTASDELIYKIAENADPESGVTLDDLMNAHGKSRSQKDLYNQLSLLAELSIQLIDESLIKLGYWSHIREYEPYNKMFDYSIETNALGTENGLWLFDLKVFRVSNNVQSANTIVVRNMLNRVFSNFYLHPDSFDRYSIVVGTRLEFEQLRMELTKYQIKDSFSIILVNGREVVEEFVVANEKNNKVIFERGNINE